MADDMKTDTLPVEPETLPAQPDMKADVIPMKGDEAVRESGRGRHHGGMRPDMKADDGVREPGRGRHHGVHGNVKPDMKGDMVTGKADESVRGRHHGTGVFERFERSMWDSFQNFNEIWDEGPMRSFFRDVHAISRTKVDWKETRDAHIFKVDLPGLTRGDVEVTIEDGRVLRIKGDRGTEKEEDGDTWHRVERSHGNFLRQFKLPDNANADEVNAKVEHGVLTVTLPKFQTTENSKQRSIQIN